MNGRWTVRERGASPWGGRPWLVLRTSGWEAAQWNGPVLRLDDGRTRHLGPDLLADDTSVRQVVARLRATEPTRPLGDVLLDQRVVAGIGNMWMAELLWHAELSPWLRIGDASDGELECAVGWGRGLLDPC